jgi:hypothetical protein
MLDGCYRREEGEGSEEKTGSFLAHARSLTLSLAMVPSSTQYAALRIGSDDAARAKAI